MTQRLFSGKHVRERFAVHLRAVFPPSRRQRLSFWGYEIWLWLGRLIAVRFFLFWIEPLLRVALYSAPTQGLGTVRQSQNPWFITFLRSAVEGAWAVLGVVMLLAVLWRSIVMRLPVLERIFFGWFAVWAICIECRYWRYGFFVSTNPYYLFGIRTPLVILAAVGLVSFEIAVRRRRRAREKLHTVSDVTAL